MKRRLATAGMALLATVACLAQQMAREEEPEDVGLTTIRSGYFPVPAGVASIPIPNAGFEAPVQPGTILKVSQLVRVESSLAPEGRAFLSSDGTASASLTLELPAAPLRPHLLSFWLKSTAPGTGSATGNTNTIYYGRTTPLNLPDTGGGWKRVGLFFRNAPDAESVRIVLRFSAGATTAIDDLRFREATEGEFSAAYAGWRGNYPRRELPPRAGDGRNLALFVSKLTNPQTPIRPVRVVAIGSSYTNMLGNGETLIQYIRQKFPHAPPVIYKKHVGSAVDFQFTRGWVRQYVLGEQPDLLILYSLRQAADLDRLLADFRAHSNADVIVASLHLREADKEITPETIDTPAWDEVREVARKYGCEWVENRREWAEYLQKHSQPLQWLLRDSVHQNDHGALVINENICRHIVPGEEPAYRPQDRERRFTVGAPADGLREGETVGFEGWRFLSPDRMVADEAGARMRVRFFGNRIDVIGHRDAGGGRADILIDGTPAADYPAFHTTLIVPGPANRRPGRGTTADSAPHLIRLGDVTKVIPQEWMLRMTSDTGDYEVIGSVSGSAGRGNNGADFTSEDGQIMVPTGLWRRRVETDGRHANRTGDVFTWRVYRATRPAVDFGARGGGDGAFQISLAENLDPGWHTLELVTAGTGVVAIQGLHIYEPPIKPHRASAGRPARR
jgi:hypothetical protein